MAYRAIIQIAEKFSQALGRRITHINNEEEALKNYMSLRLSEQTAQFMVGLEKGSEAGSEDRIDGDVEMITGKKGKRLERLGLRRSLKADIDGI